MDHNNNTFKVGDVVRNKKPYKYQHPYLIVGEDDLHYHCAVGVGIHGTSKGFDEDYLMYITKDSLNTYYELLYTVKKK